MSQGVSRLRFIQTINFYETKKYKHDIYREVVSENNQ